MREWTGKRYWLVGASEGLGRALAHRLSRVGTELVISARNAPRLTELAEALPGRAHVVPCDVTDRASVAAAAEEAGEADGLVYLAGVHWPVTATAWDADKVEAMCDVNLGGCVRVLGEVVPKMVARDQGHVVLTGAVAGFRGRPGTIGYGASKAGIINLAESMHADLSHTGVQVQLVTPGYTRSGQGAPERAARAIFEHMNGESLSRSLPRLSGAVARSGRGLPNWAYYRLFRSG